MPSIVARLCVLALLTTPVVPARTQENQQAAQPQDQYFTGTVTALSADRITVNQKVLGKETARTFTVTPETKWEGKPKLKARVTVRFTVGEGGDRAVHIIVRNTQKK